MRNETEKYQQLAIKSLLNITLKSKWFMNVWGKSVANVFFY